MNDAALIASNAVSGLQNRAIEAPRPTADAIKARQTAESFEAVFLSEVLNQMSSGLKTDGPFGGGFAEGIYRSMMNEQVAKTIARTGGVGVADKVMAEILKTQEGIQ